MPTRRTSVPVPKLDAYEEEERTLLQSRGRAPVSSYTTRVTKTVAKVDARLIAIARGDLVAAALAADAELPPTVPPPPSAPPSVIPLTDEDLIEVEDLSFPPRAS